MGGGLIMRVKEITLEAVEERLISFQEHIIYYYDQLVYGKVLDTVVYEQVNEGFLFNKQGCIHLYRDGSLKAVLFEYEENDDFIEENQLGAKNTNVSTITVRKWLDHDNEGQFYIRYTLPYALTLHLQRGMHK